MIPQPLTILSLSSIAQAPVILICWRVAVVLVTELLPTNIYIQLVRRDNTELVAIICANRSLASSQIDNQHIRVKIYITFSFSWRSVRYRTSHYKIESITCDMLA